MNITDVVKLVSDAATKIHAAIGPGCFAKAYEEALYYELVKTGLPVDRQLLMPVFYEQLIINEAFKIDLLVDQKLVIEIKTVDKVMPVHFKQVKAYLKLLSLKQGMILNFKSDSVKDGIHRIVNESGK